MNKKLLLGLLLTGFVGSGCAAQGGDEPSRSSEKRRAEGQPEGEPAAKRKELGALVEFYNACKNGHTEIVETFLKRGTMSEINAGVLEKDEITCTPLAAACENGHTVIVSLLVNNAKVDINAGLVKADGSTTTPFYIACFKANTEVVRAFLDSEKVNINAGMVYANGATITPFYGACANSHTEVVRILLEKLQREDINFAGVVRADGATVTPIYGACRNGHVEVVRLLLASGKIEDINAGMVEKVGIRMMTPFYAACRNGHTEIVQLLLATKKAEMRKVYNGSTAYSVANGTIKELIKQHAAQEDKACGVCLDEFKKDQALHFSDCCQKAIHLHCALGVSLSAHNVCTHCNLPATRLNSFLYEGDSEMNLDYGSAL